MTAKLSLSPAAVTAIISTGTSRQGAKPWEWTPASVMEELKELGLIGDGGGLTRKGTIQRDLHNEIPF